MSILAVITYDDGSNEQVSFENFDSNALDILQAYVDSNDGYRLFTQGQKVTYTCYPLTNAEGGCVLHGVLEVESGSLIIRTSEADMDFIDPSGHSIADYCDLDMALDIEQDRPKCGHCGIMFPMGYITALCPNCGVVQ